MNGKTKFAVIGGGSWATATKVMRKSFWSFVVYAKWNGDSTPKKHKHNPNYLSSVEFDTKKLKLTSDINEAVAYADYIIFAIPSAFKWRIGKTDCFSRNKVIFSAIKGIVPETSMIVGEISL
jgi:glycerol-3-phosphate dehydrogenase (NAD(P)+)